MNLFSGIQSSLFFSLSLPLSLFVALPLSGYFVNWAVVYVCLKNSIQYRKAQPADVWDGYYESRSG